MPMSARHGGATASSESSPTLLHEKPSEVSVLCGLRHGDADAEHLLHALGGQGDACGVLPAGEDVDDALGRDTAGNLQHQLHGAAQSHRRQARPPALLEPQRRLCAQLQRLRLCGAC